MRLAAELVVLVGIVFGIGIAAVQMRADALEKAWPGIAAYKAELAKQELKRQ